MTRSFPYTSYKLQTTNYKTGAAAISTILIIAVIVSEIAIAALVTSYFASQGQLGTRIVYNASFAAQSGIDDALLKITRNKDFNPSPNPYSISIGGATAQVTVCIDKTTTNESTPCNNTSGVVTGTREITSVGTALNREVKMRALIYLNPTTGLINIQYLKEIST